MAAFYERAYNERDKTESGRFADEYVRLLPRTASRARHRVRVPAGAAGAARASRSRKSPTLARARLSGDEPRRSRRAAGEAGLPPPSEGDLHAALAAARQGRRHAVERRRRRRARWSKSCPSRRASRRAASSPNLGVTVVRFANGVEAWLKPTDFKNDQVLFTMYALGGASLASPDRLRRRRRFATTVRRPLRRSAASRRSTCSKLLAGKLASASPFISLLDPRHQRLGRPGGARDGAAAALSGLHRARRRPRGVRADEAPARGGGRQPRPESRPGLRRAARADQHVESLHVPAADRRTDRQSLDRAKMLSFYRARFANAADFTFFMVGAFKLDDAMPLLARYVGSLPSTGTQIVGVQGHRHPLPDQDRRRERVEKGREPRSQTVISFFADPSPDPVEQEQIGAATIGARDRAARHAARGARPDLHGLGRPRAVAAAARRRPYVRSASAPRPRTSRR